MTTSPRLNSQARKILAHLKAGRTITHLDAEAEFNCMRLAARICDLRKAGYRIKSEPVTTLSGARIAEYRLEQPDFTQRGLFA